MKKYPLSKKDLASLPAVSHPVRAQKMGNPRQDADNSIYLLEKGDKVYMIEELETTHVIMPNGRRAEGYPVKVGMFEGVVQDNVITKKGGYSAPSTLVIAFEGKDKPVASEDGILSIEYTPYSDMERGILRGLDNRKRKLSLYDKTEHTTQEYDVRIQYRIYTEEKLMLDSCDTMHRFYADELRSYSALSLAYGKSERAYSRTIAEWKESHK